MRTPRGNRYVTADRFSSKLVLRWILFADAAVMAVIGFAFWGNYPGPLHALGIPLPDGYDALAPWRGVSMAGLFGGALLAFASALAALALSRDRQRLLVAAPIVTVGTCALGFVAFAKVTAFGFPAPGRWLVIALMAPAALLTIGFALDASRERLISPDMLRLRDAASQAVRHRLAQDLHDSVKQQIYAVQTHLAAAEARWDTDASGARTAVAHARAGARDAMREMTALLDRLDDDPVETVGLIEALRRQAEAIGFQTGADVATEFGALPEMGRVAPAIMNALFRIGQEALANIARHARPNHVSIFAGLTGGAGDEKVFALRIRDDGSGFDAERASDAAAAGMGLRSMRERANEIGAALAITSRVGQGTTIEATVPVPSRQTASVGAARGLLAGAGLPTLALVYWCLASPEWWSYLAPFVVTGLVAIASLAGWIVANRGLDA